MILRNNDNRLYPWLINGKSVPMPFGGNMLFAIPDEEDEGITLQVDKSGGDLDRAISVSDATVVDLLCEGEIEGLNEYELIGTGVAGKVGYDSVTKKTFAAIRTEAVPDEGPVPLWITDGVKFLRSIKWNGLPVVNGLDQFNYQQVNISTTHGLADGGINYGLSEELDIFRSIGERLRGHKENFEEFAKVYRIDNKNAKGCTVTIKFQGLQYTEKKSEEEYGDVRDTTVDYEIFYRSVHDNKVTVNPIDIQFVSGGKVTVTGKITAPYLKSTTIDFSGIPNVYTEGHIGWEVKIVRYTEDSLSTEITNTTIVDSISEIYGQTYRYPHSVAVQTKFSAEFFTRIPTRNFDARLMKVKIPADYNSVLRRYGQTYNGVANPYWKGDFKAEKTWTDNPVWCYYDLITNKRYGLGKYINEDSLDKWTLYEISKYCDTMVPDGYGGVEPRFTCNMLINSRTEAFRLINDLSSVFRGLAFYYGGQIHTVIDEPKSPITLFTNSNVVSGEFVYSSSSKKARATVAIVTYRDKRDDFKRNVEYVEDVQGIRKFGIRYKEISGVGITSRGQARRLGLWSIYTAALDTETVAFDTGIEASILRPGDVIRVQDANKTTKRYCGRCTVASDAITFTLDDSSDDFTINRSSSSTYNFEIIVPAYRIDSGQIDLTGKYTSNDTRASDLAKSQVVVFKITGNQISSSNPRVVTLNTNQLNQTLKTAMSKEFITGKDLTWVLEPTGNTVTLSGENDQASKLFRILNLHEKEGGSHFSVSALEHNPNKFSNIDNDESYDLPISNPSVNPPLAVELESQNHTTNTKKIKYTIIPSDEVGVYGYLVYAKKAENWDGDDFTQTDSSLGSSDAALSSIPNDEFLIGSLSLGDLTNFYIPSSSATYYFRVYSQNRLGTPSSTSAPNSVTVTGVNPIYDTEIQRLSLVSALSSDQALSQAAGTTTTQITDVSEPIITWETSVAGLNADISYGYKITIRAPSRDNRPSTVIYKTIDLSESEMSPENLRYKYTYADQVSAASSFNSVPIRDYDVVVEAINGIGESSAGTIGSNGATNPVGYDILNIRNPQISKIPLTPETSLEECLTTGSTASFCTQQWLNADKEIIISLLKAPSLFLENTTIVGGLLLFSANDFQAAIDNENIKSETWRTNNGIITQTFLNNGNGTDSITIPTNLTDKKGYMAIALADDLDMLLRKNALNGNEDKLLDSIFPQLSNSVFVKDNVDPPKDVVVESVDFDISSDTTVDLPPSCILVTGYIRYSMNQENGARAVVQLKTGAGIQQTIDLGGATGGDRTGNVFGDDAMKLTYTTTGSKKSPSRTVYYNVDTNVSVDKGMVVQDSFCFAIPQMSPPIDNIRIFKGNGANPMVGKVQQFVRFINPLLA